MMYEASCKLISTSITQNSIGLEIKKQIEQEIPIIKIEDVYSKEYYEAREQGFKPTLRLRISSLNYSGQEELVYMGTNYSIIRTQNVSIDEIVLICERKISDVN